MKRAIFCIIHRFSVEIKPEICKLFKNLLRPFHMKEHVRIINENQKSGPHPRYLRRRNPFLFFDSRILRQLLRPRESRKSKFVFAIESTDHVLACHARGFLIFATWWRYRANGNLHWNFLQRHGFISTESQFHMAE